MIHIPSLRSQGRVSGRRDQGGRCGTVRVREIDKPRSYQPPLPVCPRNPVGGPEIDRPAELDPPAEPAPCGSYLGAHRSANRAISRPRPGRCLKGLDRIACERTRRHMRPGCWRVSPFVPPAQLSPSTTSTAGTPRAARGRRRPQSLAAGCSDAGAAGHLPIPASCWWRRARRRTLPVICIPAPCAVTTAPGEQWACRRGVFCFEASYAAKARCAARPCRSWPRERPHSCCRSAAPVGRTVRACSICSQSKTAG